MTGNDNILNCRMNDVGSINAENLVAKKCKAVVNGTGNCIVYTNEEIDAMEDGAGAIYCYGNPKIVQTSITSIGQI